MAEGIAKGVSEAEQAQELLHHTLREHLIWKRKWKRSLTSTSYEDFGKTLTHYLLHLHELRLWLLRNLTLWVRYPSALVVRGHKLKPGKTEPKIEHKAGSWYIVWAEQEAFRRWVKALHRSLNEGTCLRCHSLPVDSLASFLSYKVQLSTHLSSWAPSHAIHCLFLFSDRLALCFRGHRAALQLLLLCRIWPWASTVSGCSAEMGTRHKATQTWARLRSTDLSGPKQKTLSCANNDQTWVWRRDLGAVTSIHPASFQDWCSSMH